MENLDTAKDKAAGKIMEAAGRMVNDKELEFTGKFKTMTTRVKDKMYDVKENVVQEANNIMDKTDQTIKKNGL